MKKGALDYIEKGADPQIIVDAVRFGLEVASSRNQQRRRQQEVADTFARLTSREKEIVTYLTRGLTAKEVGRALTISPRTVEIHRSRILEKIGVKTIAELVALAIEHGVNPTST